MRIDLLGRRYDSRPWWNSGELGKAFRLAEFYWQRSGVQPLSDWRKSIRTGVGISKIAAIGTPTCRSHKGEDSGAIPGGKRWVAKFPALPPASFAHVR